MLFFILKKADTFKKIGITNNKIKKIVESFYLKLESSFKLVNINRAYGNISGIIKAFFINLALY